MSETYDRFLVIG